MHYVFNVMAILTTIAAVLPVFSGYVLAMTALICQLLPNWRAKFTGDKTSKTVAKWNLPIGVMLGSISLAVAVSVISSNPDNHKEAVNLWGNSIVKYGLLWIFMRNFVTAGVRHFQYAGMIARALGPVLGLHFCYCLLQRYTGVDWAHGLGKILPDNRFAYGVYRVSGFSSHPLTLGYQLCFVTILAAALAFQDSLTQLQKRSAAMGAIFAALTILISGSRGPLVVLLASLIVLFLNRISRRLWMVLGAGGVIGVVLAANSGLLSRFYEIANRNSGDTRFMDWKVYFTAFLDHPIFGLGPAGFRSAISAYYSRFGGDANIGLAHNMFLQIAGEMGLVGLLGLCFWISTWVRVGAGFKSREKRDVFFAFFAGVILSGMTQNSLRDSGVVFTMTFVTLTLASLFDFDRSDDKELHERNPRENEG